MEGDGGDPDAQGFLHLRPCFHWTDWGALIKEFLSANRQARVGDFGLLQSWRTGRLGLPWEAKVETNKAQDLWSRREVYECDNT